MPIPIKSRYTIAEAAEFIASATGETVTQSQILDWGSQGFYRLYLPLEWATVRQVGKTDIARIGDSIVEVRLSSGQAATLGKGQRVGVSACWRDGIECNFMRQMSADYSGWTPDTVYFSSAGPVLLGAELIAFTASIAEPQKTAPATDTALELTAKPETVADVAKPWLQVDPRDPNPEQHWYTPARYFARQLVIADTTLLTKKLILADKVSSSLAGVGIFKRGGKKPHKPDTVLKAFANVQWG